MFETFDDKHLILSGCAGTGKTLLALYLALKAVLEGDDYKKIILIRSVVPTRDIGFLPGNAREKSQPYETPYIEVCNELFDRGDAYNILKQRGIIEFTTTSFVRGITLRDCIVIIDECENLTLHECDSVLTRVGENCKIIFSGDYSQTDFIKYDDRKGLNEFLRVLDGLPEHFKHIIFTENDIVRSKLVKDYLVMKRKMGVVT